jgi:hypothetical protein
MSLGGPCLTGAIVSSSAGVVVFSTAAGSSVAAEGSAAAADLILKASLRFFMCGYSVDEGLVSDEEADVEAVDAVVDDTLTTSTDGASCFVFDSSLSALEVLSVVKSLVFAESNIFHLSINSKDNCIFIQN